MDAGAWGAPPANAFKASKERTCEMKIDPREIAALAGAQPSAPRMNMYAGIHKALRACMADTLLGLGRMDVDDDLEFVQTGDRVMQLLDLCLSHLRHENQFIHAAMEAREPGACHGVQAEHAEHEQAISALAGGVAHLLGCARATRSAAAHTLYRQLALFIAHNFAHMNVEEAEHNRVLWAHYTDEELVRIHDALVASIPAQEMMAVARWMVPFMSPAERTAMLSDMQQNAPAPAFSAMLSIVQPHLTTHGWGKLMRSLGLPPTPGAAVKP